MHFIHKKILKYAKICINFYKIILLPKKIYLHSIFFNFIFLTFKLNDTPFLSHKIVYYIYLF